MKLTLKTVREELAKVGITIRKTGFGSEMVVRIKGSPSGHGYFTEWLDDALSTGLQMSKTGNSIQV